MGLLQIRVDEELKKQASAIYNELGIDISTAVRMFLKRTVQIVPKTSITKFSSAVIWHQLY